MKFTLDPMPGENGFLQWKDAMKALARLPGGIPKEFRKSVIIISNNMKFSLKLKIIIYVGMVEFIPKIY